VLPSSESDGALELASNFYGVSGNILYHLAERLLAAERGPVIRSQPRLSIRRRCESWRVIDRADNRDCHTSHKAGSIGRTEEAESKYADRRMAASKKVPGAFGKEH
jgi:hypothetical protein